MRRDVYAATRWMPVFFPKLDVSRRLGTTDSVEKARIRSRPGIRLAASLPVIGAIAVLYLFSPAQYPFYPRCIFHSLTGLDCPGCGSLRALHQLLHGNIAVAFWLNPLFVLLLSAAGLFLLRSRHEKNHQPTFTSNVLLWLMLAGMISFAVLRNVSAVFR